jgi:hypothetical protein
MRLFGHGDLPSATRFLPTFRPGKSSERHPRRVRPPGPPLPRTALIRVCAESRRFPNPAKGRIDNFLEDVIGGPSANGEAVIGTLDDVERSRRKTLEGGTQ